MPIWSAGAPAGLLTIDGVPMTCPAWRLRDPGRLLFGSPLRGSYVQIPGMDGELPVPMRGTSAQWSLDMMMAGRWDHTGAEFADEQTGFESNLNYLRANVETGWAVAGNRLRPATFLTPAGTTLTADVHCWLVPGEFDAHLWRMTLELRIPAGGFA